MKIILSEIISEYVQWTNNLKTDDLWCLCPFHLEDTASFHCNDSIGRFYCFGCGVSGNYFDFIMKINNFTTKQTFKFLKNKYNNLNFIKKKQVKKGSNKIYYFNKIISLYYENNLYKDKTMSGIKYLNERKIDDNIIKKFNLGFSCSNNILNYLKKFKIKKRDLVELGIIDNFGNDLMIDRIIFPIKSKYNKILGFSGRSIYNNLPKYYNSKNSPIFKRSNWLYNIDNSIDTVILVEGYIDVMSLYSIGINSVSSFGNNITLKQLSLIWKKKKIIVCFDGDTAGRLATKKILLLILKLKSSFNKVKFALLPDGLDPDNMVTQKKSNLLKFILKNPLSIFEYTWFAILENKNISDIDDIMKIKLDIENYLCKIKDFGIKLYFKANLFIRFNILIKDFHNVKNRINKFKLYKFSPKKSIVKTNNSKLYLVIKKIRDKILSSNDLTLISNYFKKYIPCSFNY